MKKIFFLSLLVASCTLVEPFDNPKDIPSRPVTGYKRSTYLDPYISTFESGKEQFYLLLTARKVTDDWTVQKAGFTQAYPYFNIGFSYFQNTSPTSSFNFGERLFFSDVFDLIRYSVNSDIFAQEILRGTFYENDGVTPRSPQTILNEIRVISFATSLAKRSLGNGVLAEASVGGFLNIVWVRDDIDYTRENINDMAIILLHEITHNMGYLHPSDVNYGVHKPVRLAIQSATEVQVKNYISLTPYHENLMISNVRVGSGARSANPYSVSCSHSDIFK